MGIRAAGTLLALLSVTAACSRKVDNAVHVDGIRQTVAGTPEWAGGDALGKRLWAIERSFYEQRGYLPAWVDGDRTTPPMKDLIQQLRYSESHGLDPSRYPVEEFERLREESQTRMGTRFERSDTSATSGLRFRQRPGPDNALGLVKFIFPNHFNVYLHDTPSDRLFARERRALSHGCIRIEDPMALARDVLRDQPQWTEPRITAAMHARREQAVKLVRPLPVHIGYWTAWVEPDGSLKGLDDPYGFDVAQQRLLTPHIHLRHHTRDTSPR